MIEDTSAPVGAQADDVGAAERRERLKQAYLTARRCEACPQLVKARTQVVYGAGDADAELMLVGEAPGAREDEQGTAYVGAAGKLVDELLASAGLSRGEVFITSILKCRPPGNREPTRAELDRCRSYLDEQIALVRPRVIATLGSFATRLLRGDPEPITEIHGRPEIRTVGGRAVRLLPLYHPAAALYTRALLDALRDDFAAVPELLALPEPPQPEPEPPLITEEPAAAESGREPVDSVAEPDAAADPAPEPPGGGQLGLF